MAVHPQAALSGCLGMVRCLPPQAALNGCQPPPMWYDLALVWRMVLGPACRYAQRDEGRLQIGGGWRRLGGAGVLLMIIWRMCIVDGLG